MTVAFSAGKRGWLAWDWMLALCSLIACGGDAGNGNAAVQVVAASTVATPTPTPAPSGVVVQAGDSIGIGEGADGWAAIDHMELGATVAIRNISVSGQALASGHGRRELDYFVHRDALRPSVLVIQQGTNDLGTWSAGGSDLYETVLRPFVASGHAAGCYVVVNTILPRADRNWSTAKERERQVYNAAVRRNAASADTVNDLAADSLIGDARSPATSSYYADALHLS